MSPPASAAAARAIPDARGPRRRSAGVDSHAGPGLRAGLERGAVRRPRRISGPARGVATAAAAAPAFAPGLPVPAPRPRPRPQAPAAPRRRRSSAKPSALTRGRLRDALLSRLPSGLLGGRALIAIVAFALIGIVTMQLSLLRLNASIGHSLERAASLQRENATFAIDNSEARSGEAIEQKGRQAGMIAVPPGALTFLQAGAAGAVRRAVQALRSNTVSSSEAGISGSASASASGSGFATAQGGETSVEAPAEAAAVEEPAAGEGVAEGASGETQAGYESAGASEAATGEEQASGQAAPSYGQEAPASEAGEAAAGYAESAEVGAGGGTQAGG